MPIWVVHVYQVFHVYLGVARNAPTGLLRVHGPYVPTRLYGAVVLFFKKTVFLPFLWVVDDVFGNSYIILVTADNIFKIIALPYWDIL